MASGVSFTVDTRELELALHELAKYAGVAPGIAMKQGGKMLARSLMKLTPPSTFAQGRKAVAEDVNRVYTTVPRLIKNADESGRIDNIKGFKAALTKAYKKGDEAEMEKLLTGPIGARVVTVKGHSRNGKNIAPYQAKRSGRPVFPEIAKGNTRFGGSLNPALHRNRQNRRGRVTGGNVASQVVTKKELNAYVKKIQGRVGWHMAGWVGLALQTGEKVPAWVLKQNLAAASGTSIVNWGKNPSIRAVNRDVKIPGYQRMIDGAVNHRVKTDAKNIDKLLAGRAVNLGFMRVDAK